MEIRAELAVAADICFDDRLFRAEAVILGLAHQGLGDGRDGGFQLDPAVRPDIGDLRIGQAEDIHPFVIPVEIAGDLIPDDLQPVFIQAGLQTAQPREVGDQVACMMVRRMDHIKQAFSLQVQIHDQILLPVQIEPLKKDHRQSSFLLMKIPLPTILPFSRRPYTAAPGSAHFRGGNSLPGIRRCFPARR